MRLGQSRTPAGMRLYAIGDVHGCDAMLAEAHDKIARDLIDRPVDDHRIVHVGDYTDRGTDSAAVIGRLARMTSVNPRVICLRGNHDAMFADFLSEPVERGPTWFANGAEATLSSYGVTVGWSLWGNVDYRDLSLRLAQALPAAHRAFLSALPLTARFGDYLFVHAGIRPGVPLAAQHPEDLIWIRDEFLNSRLEHGKLVVHGHSISETVQVNDNRIGIDTGAYFSGELTALVLQDADQSFLHT
jgi:serine/threonine protein phosphatase 1